MSVDETKINFQWANMDTFEIRGFEKCISDIIIEKYLSNGSFGLVYKVVYKNKICAIKIIPLYDETHKLSNNKIEPLFMFTLRKDFESEINILQIVSENNIGPKLYNYGICNINFFDKSHKKNIKMEIGFIIEEFFDITMGELLSLKKKELIDNLNQILNTGDIRNIEIQTLFIEQIEKTFDFLNELDKKLIRDILRAEEIGIINTDLENIGNIMYKFSDNSIKITDWGKTLIGNKRDYIRPDSLTELFLFENVLGEKSIIETVQKYWKHLFSQKGLYFKNM